jgi:hypothetical protein
MMALGDFMLDAFFLVSNDFVEKWIQFGAWIVRSMGLLESHQASFESM